MAEWTEKCLTCAKSGSVPKWGWSWGCDDQECKYEPIEIGELTVACDDE